jgi:hypothetical protein
MESHLNVLLRENERLRVALSRLHRWALAQEGDCMFSGDHPIAQAAAALNGVTFRGSTPGVLVADKVQLPDKARAGIEVLHQVVESLLTTSRYVDEEGEATMALADLSACIADPPFKLGTGGVDSVGGGKTNG